MAVSPLPPVKERIAWIRNNRVNKIAITQNIFSKNEVASHQEEMSSSSMVD